MSASYDGAVKVWDLKSSSAVGNVEVGCNSVLGMIRRVLCLGSGNSPEHYVLDAFLGDILAIVRLAISSSPRRQCHGCIQVPYTGCCTFSPCGRTCLSAAQSARLISTMCPGCKPIRRREAGDFVKDDERATDK
ncbi:hypothetical protein Cantr_03559 [Candida viswanathii]|uniref:Uncharacterized protein n=1 Tax=Candida viswanathii TaxID=5486 RepID=A0A367YL02_9ASCO|nr:hypothetical protein Cantr_03559 [Candida viswanathii]